MLDKYEATLRYALKSKVLLLLLILGVFTLIYTYTNSSISPESIARQQIKAIQEKDYGEAYYDYTSTDYQKHTSLNDFRKWIKNHSVLRKNTEAHFFDLTHEPQQSYLSAILTDDEGVSTPATYTFVKENKSWKIDSVQLPLTPQSPIALASPTETSSSPLIPPVMGILESIRTGKFKKAYEEYTSLEFQKTTSLKEFRDFLQSTPELTDFSDITVDRISANGNTGSIEVNLTHTEGSSPIEITLSHEQGVWKVQGLRVLSPISMESAATPNRSALIETIRQFLSQLRDRKTNQAYENLTSPEFQKVTNLEEFEKFVQAYPELTTYETLQFGDSEVSQGIHRIQANLASDQGESLVNFWLVADGNEWKIWGLKIEESASRPSVVAAEQEQIVSVIEKQLAALRNKDTSKAYYAFASVDFEKATPLADFKKFIDSYPIFSQHTQTEFGKAVEMGKLRLMRVTLINNEDKYEVDYRLFKESGKWKIWGMQILAKKDSLTPSKEDVISTIESQLEAIKQQDFSQAYYGYTSEQFQEKTSEDLFEKFIQGHPPIANNRYASFTNYNFKNNVAMVNAELTSLNNVTENFEYRLIFERNQWKILHIASADKKQEGQSHQMELTEGSIGTNIDLKGRVTNPSTLLAVDSGDITLNLHVENGVKGETVTVVLHHLDSDSKIAPVSASITEDGKTMISFIFSPPTQGWPEGNYSIHAQTSTGQSKDYNFIVVK